MRVAHMTVVTPGRCGLYETTRELVAGLRNLGVDSRIVDPTKKENKLHPDTEGDRGALFGDMNFALKADVLVSHSGLGKVLEKTNQPLIHVAHGRPRNSFIHEMQKSHPIYSYTYFKNKEKRCKAIATFWPEHEPYLRVMCPDTHVRVIQAPVDLDAWCPGPAQYEFHGKGGEINVVCADMWREDVDPFVPLNAYALWARQTKGTKLHLYGVQDKKGPAALIRTIQNDGTMGEIRGFTTGLAHVYRAADFVITAHHIDTRTVREATACGCPVVRIPGPHLNGFCADIERIRKMSRETARSFAEDYFDPRETARQFHKLLEDLGGVDGERF